MRRHGRLHNKASAVTAYTLSSACMYMHARSVNCTSEEACIEAHGECVQYVYAFASSM